MFDRVSKLAERTATGLSRRAFMQRLGQGAVSIAALLTTAGFALAGAKVTCVKNGGCCKGGNTPYLCQFVEKTYTTYACCVDAKGNSCVLCANSACCKGGGYCNLGLICYSDIGCNTPC